MQLNTIRALPGATQKRKRLGRGSGSGLGQTAGKGDKGQLARSGGTTRPGFEGGQMPLYRRLPKKGFTNVHRRAIAEVNLSQLEGFKAKEVTLATLLEGGIIKGQFDRLAILGTGEIKGGFTFKAHRVSASAKEKIEKAGGKVELIKIPGKQIKNKKKTAAKAKN
ncbi:MAG: 50S ribosomal protein L15 [Bdellovibrionales bacterium]|nr:50S ribosomal protein L15 [Bdellovibrionales bacterium]